MFSYIRHNMRKEKVRTAYNRYFYKEVSGVFRKSLTAQDIVQASNFLNRKPYIYPFFFYLYISNINLKYQSSIWTQNVEKIQICTDILKYPNVRIKVGEWMKNQKQI